LPVLVVVPTLAPMSFANWMANVPMPPDPAGMKTFWPDWSLRRSLSACQEVSPTIGIDTGQIATQGGGKLEFHDGLEDPGGDHVVDRVDAGGMDLDQ
jgi:hypothetical protein